MGQPGSRRETPAGGPLSNIGLTVVTPSSDAGFSLAVRPGSPRADAWQQS
jgi:hypothetical protein